MEKELYTRDQQVKNLSETVHKMESELAISQQRAELLQKELQPLDNVRISLHRQAGANTWSAIFR